MNIKSINSDSFEYDRYRFSAADAECCQSISGITFMQFANHRGGKACATGADRVADGAGAAIDVDLVKREFKPLDGQQRHGSKGFVLSLIHI